MPRYLTVLSIFVEAAANTLIAFAARAGATAADNDGDHSPFTNALLPSI
jgi:hypothetical protein